MQWRLKQQSLTTKGYTELYSQKYFSESLLRLGACIISAMTGLITKDFYWWKVFLPWSINFRVHHIIMNWVNYLQPPFFFFASIQQKNCKCLDVFWDFSKNISSPCLAQITSQFFLCIFLWCFSYCTF